MSAIVFPLDSVASHYDMVIGSCGYESRCRRFLTGLNFSGDHKIALGFTGHQVLAFEDNRQAFVNHGFIVDCVAADEVGRVLEAGVERILDENRKDVSVLIDISGMTRTRLGLCLLLFLRSFGHTSVRIDFVYYLADFSRPSDSDWILSESTPVLPEFAGWSPLLEKSVALVLGLGYENNLALGIYEEVEPSETWLLIPQGGDSRFEDMVAENNRVLIEQMNPMADRIRRYDLVQPFSVFEYLESALYGLSKRARVELVPLGPKIFFLVALLVRLHNWEVTVRRLDKDQPNFPRDITSSSSPIGISLVIRDFDYEKFAGKVPDSEES